LARESYTSFIEKKARNERTVKVPAPGQLALTVRSDRIHAVRTAGPDESGLYERLIPIEEVSQADLRAD
jgi:hypothetical protein